MLSVKLRDNVYDRNPRRTQLQEATSDKHTLNAEEFHLYMYGSFGALLECVLSGIQVTRFFLHSTG